MRLISLVSGVVLASASLWAQAMIGYGGALAPATGFAAHLVNPAVNIHPKQIVPAEGQTHSGAPASRARQSQAELPRGANQRSSARDVRLPNPLPNAQQATASGKKISDPGAITIQR